MCQARSTPERTCHDFQHVTRQAGVVANAFQCSTGVSLAAGVEFLPAIETTGEARGDLRVAVVQFDHPLGDEGVTAAIGGIEARQIGPEGADQ